MRMLFFIVRLSRLLGRYPDFYNTNVIGTQQLYDATPESARLIHVSLLAFNLILLRSIIYKRIVSFTDQACKSLCKKQNFS